MGLLSIENLALNQIRAYAKNAKNHPEGQVQQIAASIRQFGFNNPILVDENLEIIAGHGRVAAAQVLGLDTVPVIRLSHLSDAQKRAYRLADNKIAENGGWNADLLRLEISELEQICDDLDISVTGFSDVELDVLSVDDKPAADPKANSVPYISENEIVTRPGDVWCLGDHQIICGNSLDAATFETLLGTRHADMVLQDPPYNVKISGHVCGSGNVRHKEFQMASGEMSTDEFTQFLRKNFELCAKHSRPGALQYNFMDWRHMGEISAAGNDVFSELINNYKFYLIDIIRGKWDTPQLFDKIIEVYNEYKYNQQAGNYVKLLIEDKASGEFLIPMLGKARDRVGRRIEVVPIKPTIDKISRAKALGVMIEKGNLLFPQKDEAWWQNCKKELLGFPNTKYKDQVDAMSQCINYAMQQ